MVNDSRQHLTEDRSIQLGNMITLLHSE